MPKIIFTGSKIDDAIRKVKSGYADVSKVTATTEDVREGKIIVDSNKIKRVGTLKDAELDVSTVVSSYNYLSASQESDYPVTFTPSTVVSKQGIINSDVSGTASTKYIQVEEKSVTPEGQAKEVTPTAGKLMTKVTVGKIPEAIDWPIENFPCPYFYYYISRSTTSSSFVVCRISSGTIANNIYLKSGVDPNDAVVYIFPITTSSSSTSYFWGTANLIDSVSHRLKDDIIEFKAGDTFTNVGSIFAPAGVLEYTTSGRLKFTFTASFDFLGPRNDENENANYGTMALFLYDGSKYYGICLDADQWDVGTQYIGTKTTGTVRRYTNRGLPGKPMIADGVNAYNFQASSCLQSNYGPIYFEWNYVNDSTAYHLACMTHGGGTGYYLPRETKKLNTPSPSISGTAISWSAITDATGYYIKITGKASYTITTTSTSYNLTNKLTTIGTYYISVRAYKSGVASDYSNAMTYYYEKRLATPVITKSGSTVSWSAVTNATTYYVYKNGVQWFTTSSTSFNLDSYSLSAGTYSIYITAYASGYTTSYASNTVTHTVLDAPTLTLSENGILSWNAVSGATYYQFIILGLTTETTTETSIDLNDYIDITESHTISVAAFQSSDVHSSYSKVYTGDGDGRSFETAIVINMTSTSITLLSQAIDDTDYPIKYYRLTVPSDGTYYIYTESDYDTYGILYDENQSQLAYNDDSGTDSNFSISYALTAGTTYFIAVRQYSSSTCEFDLYIDEIGPSTEDTPTPKEPEPEPYQYQDI